MKVFILLIFILTSGCGILSRHKDSGYEEYGNYEREYGAYTQESAESTYEDSTPIERLKRDERAYILELEQRLESPEERDQYETYKALFQNNRERIEFLSLDGIRTRERYLITKGIKKPKRKYSRAISSVIRQNDVAIGMDKEGVRQSWGDPDIVEVSGNIKYENERWRYTKFIPTADGYREEKRILYFEAGKLVGWERR